jgi:hypothetical protein
MAKLTDTQLIVLSKAARREDGAAGVPPNEQGRRRKGWSEPGGP